MPTRTVVCAVLALSCFASNPCLARTIRVPSEQPTILAGLTLANPGDTVLVAPGVYSGDGNRDLTFAGKDLVLRSEAGPEATVLDGTAPSGELHHGIFFYDTGETRACLIEGFTFRNFHGQPGPALYVSGASPTVADCVFSDNSAGYKEYLGSGGAVVLANSSALVNDSRFEHNSAFEGGGAVACGGSGSSDLTFERCTFSQNHSVSYYEGGAVACGWGGPFSFVDCAFVENSAQSYGGAVSLYSSTISPGPSSAIFEGCAFGNNEAAGRGGAIGASAEGSASLVVRDCVFFQNLAGSYGGAVSCAGNVSVDVRDATFAANRASPGSGIALLSYGSIAPDAILDRVIVVFGELGQAIHCGPGSGLSAASCCDVYGNAGGDWVGCVEAFEGAEGNFSADPLFCDLYSGDLTLEARSPCLPGQHPHGSDCGLIGALGQGCTGPTAVEPSTWGALKATYCREHLAPEEKGSPIAK